VHELDCITKKQIYQFQHIKITLTRATTLQLLHK